MTTSERRARERRSAKPMSAVNEVIQSIRPTFTSCFFQNVYRPCYYVALQCKILENNAENRRVAEELISTAMKNNAFLIATKLYAARVYKFMFENDIEEYADKKDKILSLYTESENSGSTLASKEKQKFLDLIEKKNFEQQRLNERIKYNAYNLCYINADQDLDNLINKIANNTQPFTMLLSGPANAGMSEFANKLFLTMNKNYDLITAMDLYAKNGIESCINKKIRAGKNGIILSNVNSCFDSNSDKNAKDFVVEKNTQCLLARIFEKRCSFILIVNDINRISQELLDGFTFKIKFNYMNTEQKKSVLKNLFNISQTDKLDYIGGLVYNDFLRIHEKATLLNISEPDIILKMIKDEANSKPNFLTYNTPVSQFDINLVNTNTDLVKLTEKLYNCNFPFTMLISGPAGTGKSYYLRYLAQKMGLNVVEKTAAELFSKYQGEPARNVLKLFSEAEEQNAAIILDEVEKITFDRSENSGSFQWREDMTNAFLTCLENTTVPFMATTNFVSDIDKAVLRRFVFKIKFDYLTPKQVAYAFRHTFNLEPPELLLKIGGLTNGDFSVVKKKAKILGDLNNANELYSMLKEEVSAKAVGHIVNIEKAINFDKDFINIEGNALSVYVEKIKENKVNNFSILLYGPSGTSKSLYLRHLAQELGYEIIERRASDLLSKYHGESEQNIANAFEEAKNHRAMLIFDEIDTFLPDKGGLLHAYDTRLVNEFLVQLENHPYPICATTSYIDNIEKASLRI